MALFELGLDDAVHYAQVWSRQFMKINSQEIVVVALLAAIATIVLWGYFLTKTEDKPIQDTVSTADKPFLPGEGPSGRPQMELSTEQVSFGTIDPYTLRTADVIVNNIGDALLTTSRIRSSCPCTQARMEKSDIQPGQQTTLHVELNPQHYHANDPRVAVIMYTNDPINPITMLKISADIQPEFTIEPAELDFGDLPVGQEHVLTLHARQELDEEFEVTRVETSRLGIDVLFKEVITPDDDGRRCFEIEVRVTPDARPGALDSNLVVWTNIERIPAVRIPIKGQVIGVKAIPSTVHFGLVEPVRGEVARMILRGPYPFEIVEIYTEMEGFSMQVVDDGAKMKHTVRMVMEAGVVPGSRHGTVNVTVLANGKHEFIVVPIHGLVREKQGVKADG